MISALREIFDGSDIVGFAALILSIFALARPAYKEWKHSRTADVRCSLISLPRHDGRRSYLIRITNNGPGNARSVVLRDPEPLLNREPGSMVRLQCGGLLFPVDVILPGDSVTCSVGFYGSSGIGCMVTVEWIDGRGQRSDVRALTPLP
jgi:hypothetical protein